MRRVSGRFQFEASNYVEADGDLPEGSTLAGPKIVTVLKANGALQKVYDVEAGVTALGTVSIRYYDRGSRFPLARSEGRFRIYPERQEHEFDLQNDLSVKETVFALCGSRPGMKETTPPAVYVAVEIHNEGDKKMPLSALAYVVLRGSTEHDVVVQFEREDKALVAWNVSNKRQVRMVGWAEGLDGHETTLDYACSTDERMPELSGDVSAPDDPLGILRKDVTIEAGSSVRLTLKVVLGAGRSAAIRSYRDVPSVDAALSQTQRYFRDVLNRAVVLTPNSSINEGVLWAKANMVRTEMHSQTGWCFTNNPMRSNSSVARDTAWFAMGADYTQPEFVRQSLMGHLDRQEATGMIPEYYDVRTGETSDYGLNVNDNTPLLLLALWHHYQVTGDIEFLENVYERSTKAAKFLLSQRNDQGLIWCTATGTSGWGIVGWRNVIPNYTLSGATTELNSECYAALGAVSQMSRVLEHHDESRYFSDEAGKLRKAINRHLLNPKNGLYYLNIDVEGRPHTDITSDLVFPVMYGVAEDDVAARVVARLTRQDFWTQAGIRTAPRDTPTYTPNGGSGLMGGIWVGVSFWYAFAVAPYLPEAMNTALASTFENYSVDPLRSNTVPGQFSEWLDGETLSNRGMMLSPWFPPRYVWAAIEGMAGLRIEHGSVRIEPNMSPGWKWLAVRNLPFRGKNLSWLATRQPDLQVSGVFGGLTASDASDFAEDCTSEMTVSTDSLLPLGFANDNALLIFVGNSSDRTVEGNIRLLDKAFPGGYRSRVFNSLLSRWRTCDAPLTEADLRRGLHVEVEPGGFVMFLLEQEV